MNSSVVMRLLFVGKYNSNATDSFYYSTVDSGSDHMNFSLKDEEVQSELSSSPFDDEDIMDKDFMNVEH